MKTSAEAILYRLPSILEALPLEKLFPREQPVEIELGSGDGSFLAEYAAANPERNFIGVERLLGRLRKIGRKGARLELHNLRAIRIECSYFVRYLLPPNSIEAIHVYFPDPWPKRRHWQKRLVGEAFPQLARRVLRKGGAVYLRTDDRDYHEQMLSVFSAAEGFHPISTPERLLAFKTDFERDFNARGITTLSAAYACCG